MSDYTASIDQDGSVVNVYDANSGRRTTIIRNGIAEDVQVNGRSVVITFGTGQICSYDAETGRRVRIIRS